MTQDEIIEMVMQIGGCDRPEDDSPALKMFVTFAKLVAEKAIKEALAQPEQEFVAWEQFYPDIGKPQIAINPEIVGYVAPQRTWVGLTDEERQDIALEVPIDAVLITEATLKDKNTQKTTGENNLS